MIGRASSDDCKCNTGYYLTRDKCERCEKAIPNCIECVPGDGKAAICTKQADGYDLVENFPVAIKCPAVETVAETYEFGDVFPHTLDLSDCFAKAVVPPETGLICQPKCLGPKYENTVPLPKWKTYINAYCATTIVKPNIKYVEDTDSSACKRMCESWSSCYYFEFLEEGRRCSLYRNNQTCEQLQGVKGGGQAGEVWQSHVYSGKSSDAFEFFCKNDGKWRAKNLHNKTAAEAFFKRQCKEVTTTTPTTTSAVQPDKKEGPDTTGPHGNIIVGIILGVVLVVIVVAFVTVVVIHRSKEKREESESNDKIQRGKSRKDTVFTGDDMEKSMNAAMDLSPIAESDEPMTLTDKDDVPT